MKIRSRIAWVVAASALFAAMAWAAPADPGLEGWSRGGAYDKLYDANREVYAPSTVVRVEHFVPQPGMAEGVRALVVTGKDSLWVHVGPSYWADAQAIQLAAGDAVVITGALVPFENATAIFASRIEKAGKFLKVRDASGTPAWTNFHRRPPA